MKHRGSKCLPLLVAASAAATVCHAQLTNPGFEDPTAFNGWSTDGNARLLDSTMTANLGVSPVSGNRFAEISNTTTISPFEVAAAALDAFLGLSTGTLASDGGWAGSAIKSQTFHAEAGQQLSFSYDFASQESPTGTHNDFAFAVIIPVTGVTTVANAFTAPFTETFPIGYQAATEFGKGILGGPSGTGWQTFTFPSFAATGDYVLGIGVMDGGTSGHIGTSGVYIDNVNLTAVPEPRAWALVTGLSLCGVALARRFRKSGDFAG